MSVWQWFLLSSAVVGAVTGLLWVLHRLCIRLEEAGYLYYREKPSGGAGGGILGELDKLVRPSIEHTIQVHEEASTEETISGE